MSVFVISKEGKKLMPTERYGKVRHMLKDGRAVIYKRNPFTIQLTYDTSTYTQDLEICEDLGYVHVGLSVKSESTEYIAQQRDLLTDEVEHHKDCSKIRRTRRNRKHYRPKRFDNRKNKINKVERKDNVWLAPSLSHKADCQINLVKDICNIAPIKDFYLEIGQFDTQVLKALEKGEELSKGTDYQFGELYAFDTLREAVFSRDNHKCICCGKSAITDKAILCTHHIAIAHFIRYHIGFWNKDRTNRISNLATVCTKCHTPKNHKEGGILYGMEPIIKSFKESTFMNTVKWYIYNELKKDLSDINIHFTYGAVTKRSRLDLGLNKSHINDAYAMGKFHPIKRAKKKYFKKRRRNNRVLEKFYDAKYVDIRDGSIKSGKDLGCQRTNRREPRNSDKNLRIYHGKKKSLGRRAIRTKRYKIQSGTIILYKGKLYESKGVQNYGNYVTVKDSKKAFPTKDVIKYFDIDIEFLKGLASIDLDDNKDI
jgi:hypothetical protein